MPTSRFHKQKLKRIQNLRAPFLISKRCSTFLRKNRSLYCNEWLKNHSHTQNHQILDLDLSGGKKSEREYFLQFQPSNKTTMRTLHVRDLWPKFDPHQTENFLFANSNFFPSAPFGLGLALFISVSVTIFAVFQIALSQGMVLKKDGSKINVYFQKIKVTFRIPLTSNRSSGVFRLYNI